MVLQPADVAMSCQGSAWEAAQCVQRGCGFLPIDTSEGGDSGAFMDCAAESQKSCLQDLFPIRRMLVAENMKHGVQVSVHPFHRVRLGVVSWCEGELDAGSPESFLHHLGPEVSGVVGVYLQWMAKPCIQHL